MIEKIPFEITQGEYKGKKFDTKSHASPYDIQEKVNELVDAVNLLQLAKDAMFYAIRDIRNAPKNTTISKMENVQDKYAEQRKCICKLCWFWNDNKADKVIGVLTGVFDEADRPFERNIDQTLYKHCEPVKPDSDIIYHGE